MHATTPAALARPLSEYFLEDLLSTEDFDSLELAIADGMRRIACRAMERCLESFDGMLVDSMPYGWSVHERVSRTVITLVGAVTFKRTIFLDRFGRRRAWADELLGIPKRSRLSANAFLWIARTAADLSYRKTASAFEFLSGAAVSHVTVMRCVHEEGRLLAAAPPDERHVSSAVAYVEADGLWVHLQNPEHRDEALPRGVYEQARRTCSFELKMACMYAGKKKVDGRVTRGNLSVIAADEEPEAFWSRIVSQLAADYELDDLETIWLGADGGQWCGPGRLEEIAPEGADVRFSLDPFHVTKAICRAFPEGPKRDWALRLAYRRKPAQLVRMCGKIAAKLPAGKRRDKVRELESYIANHSRGIAFPRPSLGTMEGTNYHFAACRVKGNATSWSRRGATAMVLIKCALLTGRPLIAPSKDAFFTGKEIAAESSFRSRLAGSVAKSVGSGSEWPHSHDMSKHCAISVSRRS